MLEPLWDVEPGMVIPQRVVLDFRSFRDQLFVYAGQFLSEDETKVYRTYVEFVPDQRSKDFDPESLARDLLAFKFLVGDYSVLTNFSLCKSLR